MEEVIGKLGELVRALRGLAALRADVAELLRRSWRLAEPAARAAARVEGIIIILRASDELALLSGRAETAAGELEVEVSGPLLSLRWASERGRGVREVDLRAAKLGDIVFAAALERLNPGLLERVAAELAQKGEGGAEAVTALRRAVKLLEAALK